MAFETILLFFIYTWGIGTGLTLFAKEAENFLERHIMRVGLGLSGLLVLLLLLNSLRLIVDWKIALLVSLLGPAYVLVRKKSFSVPKIKPNVINLCILGATIIFLVSMYMYTTGAFTYPYLEDDDSYSHAAGVSYIKYQKTLFDPQHMGFQYIDPYPPSYDGLMGILHQTNNSVSWTLKFFNALVISISLLFFFFSARMLLNSSFTALLATAFLAAMPAYLSHFIWAISLMFPVLFASLYAFERIGSDRRWAYVAATVTAPGLVMTPSHSVYFALMLGLYALVKIAFVKHRMHILLAGCGAGLLSLLLWWVWPLTRLGFSQTLVGLGLGRQDIFAAGGTGDRPYVLADFIFVKSQGLINSPLGFGLAVSILLVVGLIVVLAGRKFFGEKYNTNLVALLWFALMMYAVNGVRFPVRLSSFRVWPLVAIPAAILAAIGAAYIYRSIKVVTKNQIAAAGLLVLILAGVYFTSFSQKYTLNTSYWPPGAFWTSQAEIDSYVWLKSLPPNTPVYTFSNEPAVIAMDKFNCMWCPDELAFKQGWLNQSAAQIHDFLSLKGYRYLIVGGQEVQRYGAEPVNDKLMEIGSAGNFRLAHQSQGAVVLEVV